MPHKTSDYVVTIQADTHLNKTWWSTVKRRLNDNCQFLQFGYGDQVMVYTHQHVRLVGLWDERMPAMGWVEGEYMFRSAMFNPQGTCCTDNTHGRMFNATWIPVEGQSPEDTWRPIFASYHTPDIQRKRNKHHVTTKQLETDYINYMNYNVAIINQKWPERWQVMGWGDGLTNPHYPMMDSLSPQPVMYPFFEKDLLRQYGRETRLLNAGEKGYNTTDGVRC